MIAVVVVAAAATNHQHTYPESLNTRYTHTRTRPIFLELFQVRSLPVRSVTKSKENFRRTFTGRMPFQPSYIHYIMHIVDIHVM